MNRRLFVLGATGRTGRHLLDLALARRHRVTAFVRSPEKLGRSDPDLTALRGDPLSADELTEALPGHDAVLSVLGPSPREAFRPHRLMAESAASLVAAMERSGQRRLVILSAALLFPNQGLGFALMKRILRHHIDDLAGMEAVVHATRFEWTIARPPRLVERPDEAYRSAAGALPPGAVSMSFRAVARFMLDCVEQASFSQQVVGLRAAER